MKAIQFTFTIPRYVFGLVLGPLHKSLYYSPLSCVQLREVPELELLGPDWVKVKTRYAGICGSDLGGLVRLHLSPVLTPFGSYPFTIGHEQVGSIAEVGGHVEGFSVGQRVVVDPVLPCPVRDIDPPCSACQEGEWSRCENFAEGGISPGVQTGSCADTGGSWSPYFLSHRFQLFAVPDNVSDENALMIEPFTTTLHAVMRNFPRDKDTVLVIGGGTIGISVVAALRCLGSKAHIILLAKYPFQGYLAEQYGADGVLYLRGNDYYEAVAEATDGRLYKPVLGKRMMIGGADLVYECVGDDRSVDDALRFVRAGGRLVLMGTIGQTKKVDWTPILFQELHVTSVNIACALEEHNGERLRPFQLAIRWMAEGKLDLSPLLTHRFALVDYRQAFAVAMSKGRNKAVKVAFEFK